MRLTSLLCAALLCAPLTAAAQGIPGACTNSPPVTIYRSNAPPGPISVRTQGTGSNATHWLLVPERSPEGTASLSLVELSRAGGANYSVMAHRVGDGTANEHAVAVDGDRILVALRRPDGAPVVFHHPISAGASVANDTTTPIEGITSGVRSFTVGASASGAIAAVRTQDGRVTYLQAPRGGAWSAPTVLAGAGGDPVPFALARPGILLGELTGTGSLRWAAAGGRAAPLALARSYTGGAFDTLGEGANARVVWLSGGRAYAGIARAANGAGITRTLGSGTGGVAIGRASWGLLAVWEAAGILRVAALSQAGAGDQPFDLTQTPEQIRSLVAGGDGDEVLVFWSTASATGSSVRMSHVRCS